MLQRITHSECIYAPGDGDLVKALFAALGFAVKNAEGHPYIIAHVDPDVLDVMSNVIYASELTPMQRAFEKTLQETLASSKEFRQATDNWEKDFRDDPQRSVHFGVQYESRESFQATVDRLRQVSGPRRAAGGPTAGDRRLLPGRRSFDHRDHGAGIRLDRCHGLGDPDLRSAPGAAVAH